MGLRGSELYQKATDEKKLPAFLIGNTHAAATKIRYTDALREPIEETLRKITLSLK
ncbi:hypothetical protein YPPY34_4410 [Yersinia pestis PY-34]|nr:hypothetical protein YPC_0348 [Yersinia pestis biovar Medievalis str. Harbin 35]EEO78989.1 hypothetical protein YPF_4652 [Yersinia pestis biovar Orientalis str. India 195]EEO85981.1 hypothetical protein YPH_1875 [Yersinia pestis biovar Orientalis str. PEXU2]EEO92158.1 hypothetical protein YPS_1118 [Yersinia pestis Pestoides A]EIR70910.1 hypothetical protein YPPY34_4410 [Yersinia pestis PY-34]EIS89624.1 hypothetical protein YPPY89_4681 [Yersinia pestis PY-89]